jgi:hypothetical protein
MAWISQTSLSLMSLLASGPPRAEPCMQPSPSNLTSSWPFHPVHFDLALAKAAGHAMQCLIVVESASLSLIYLVR